MSNEADLGPESSQAADLQYEFQSVQALRGRENSAKTKWLGQGWELVSEKRGTLRTELNFRRVKPKTFAAHVLSFVATVRRSQPKTLLPVVVVGMLIVVAGIVGVFVATQGDDDPAPRSAAKPTVSTVPSGEASTVPSADPAAPAISVDELLDRLNSRVGGVQVGDQFRVTGELFESDIWGTGKSDDFIVYLKAKGGADDLAVFVDESNANRWEDGTQVEMVVKMVERTIDGEKIDGFMEAQSVETTAGTGKNG